MTTPLVLAGFLGTPELVVILLLALLFFGASKMPGIARSLGRSVNEFKAGMKDEPAPQKKPDAPAPAPSDSGAQKN
jgi:sec-independent protein translocase protein TatA